MAERPRHVGAAALAGVAFGGFFGAAGRDAVATALPSPAGGFPLATFAVNVVGAFVLGALLEALGEADSGPRRTARLVGGTGFIGAFTTYSTFAIETDLLIHGSHVAMAVLYAAATVAAGLVAVAAGIAVVGRGRRPGAGLPLDPDIDPQAGRRS